MAGAFTFDKFHEMNSSGTLQYQRTLRIIHNLAKLPETPGVDCVDWQTLMCGPPEIPSRAAAMNGTHSERIWVNLDDLCKRAPPDVAEAMLAAWEATVPLVAPTLPPVEKPPESATSSSNSKYYGVASPIIPEEQEEGMPVIEFSLLSTGENQSTELLAKVLNSANREEAKGLFVHRICCPLDSLAANCQAQLMKVAGNTGAIGETLYIQPEPTLHTVARLVCGQPWVESEHGVEALASALAQLHSAPPPAEAASLNLSLVVDTLLDWLSTSGFPEPVPLGGLTDTVRRICAAVKKLPDDRFVLNHGDLRPLNVLVDPSNGATRFVNCDVLLVSDKLHDLSQVGASDVPKLLSHYLGRDPNQAELGAIQCYRLTDTFVHSMFHWLARIDAAASGNPRHYKEVEKQKLKFSEEDFQEEFDNFGVTCNPRWNQKFGEQYRDLILKFRWMEAEAKKPEFIQALEAMECFQETWMADPAANSEAADSEAPDAK